jgi:hypothetical protein
VLGLAFRPLFVGLGGAAAGGMTLWLLRSTGPAPATLAALIVYGGLLTLFGLVRVADIAAVVGWFRPGAAGAWGASARRRSHD